MYNADKIIIKHEIENGGAEHCFEKYSEWKHVDDDRFQFLLKLYRYSKGQLLNYVELKN